MIFCDYIKKLNSTLSEVYKGDELKMTAKRREAMKRIPLTFVNRAIITLGNGFTNVQYCIDYKGDGTDNWVNVPTTRNISYTGPNYTVATNNPSPTDEDPKPGKLICSILRKEGITDDVTISIRARWINNRVINSDSSYDIHIDSDFRLCPGIATQNHTGVRMFGNINSLLDYNFKNITSLANFGTHTFRGLFCSDQPPTGYGVPINGDDLDSIVLPNTVLSDYCYMDMFSFIINLDRIPTLFMPRNTVMATDSCYAMFCNLRNSVNMPVVIERDAFPSTQLATKCYYKMFESTDSRPAYIKFATGFKLPATTLAPGCYRSMFECCKMQENDKLPGMMLPATTLTMDCYREMFKHFSWANSNGAIVSKSDIGLTLPATTLAQSCYAYMFDGARITSTVKLPKRVTLAGSCFEGMYANNPITQANFDVTVNLVPGCYTRMFEGCTIPTSGRLVPDYTMAPSYRNHNYTNPFSGVFNNVTPAQTALFRMPEDLSGKASYSYLYSGLTNATGSYTITLDDVAGGERMFSNSGISSITLNVNNTSVTNNYQFRGMFNSCLSLTTAKIVFAPGTTFNGTGLLSSLFYYCLNLTSVTIKGLPDFENGAYQNLQGIFDYMFYDCEKLDTIKLDLPSIPSGINFLTNLANGWVTGAGQGEVSKTPTIYFPNAREKYYGISSPVGAYRIVYNSIID